MTDMKDITLSATDLVFTPSHPVNGDSVVLSITAHNAGIKDTGPFNLALYDGDPAAGGVLVNTYPVSNIPGDAKTTLSYAFTAIPWTYRSMPSRTRRTSSRKCTRKTTRPSGPQDQSARRDPRPGPGAGQDRSIRHDHGRPDIDSR